MRTVLIAMCLCASVFACKGHKNPAINCGRDALPTSGFDQIYTSINGNGEYAKETYEEGKRRTKLFIKDITNMDRLAQKYEVAIRGMVQIAVRNLSKFDFDDEAAEIERDWKSNRGELSRIVKELEYDERAQQDLKGYFEWLDTLYLKIESKLGYQLCHALRLDDLYSLNRGQWMFKPCLIGESQWTCVLCGDKHVDPTVPNPRRGDLPILSYWATQVTCGVATFGAGVIGFICGPIAMVVEYTVDEWGCPRLEPWLFDKVCG